MIELVHLKKKIGSRLITKDVSLVIPEGKMTLIIGRSGEGKSILLKQMIGLMRPTEGKILVRGIDIAKLSGAALQSHVKKFGFVFQFAALLDSLNAYENIGITLVEKGVPAEEVLRIVKDMLKLVNLKEDVLYKYPSELSGGMCKRVGLARTLVTKPEVVLYDEPTTGLDPITSSIIHKLMFEMQKKFGLTSVVVTHDVEFFAYADYVALLHEGVIRYVGDAKTIWDCDNPYVYQCIRGLTHGPMQSELAECTTE